MGGGRLFGRAMPIEERWMKASDLFVKALETEGVEYVFGIPGEENLDFLDCSARARAIQLVLTRHEQGAGFMAADVRPPHGQDVACVISTLGPGATNLVTTCAAYASPRWHADAVPDHWPEADQEAASKGRVPDRSTSFEMMEPHHEDTRARSSSGNNIPHRRSAKPSASPRGRSQGPVHLELPEDVAARAGHEARPFAVESPCGDRSRSASQSIDLRTAADDRVMPCAADSLL